MEKTFLAASLISLMIISLAPLVQGSVFDSMPFVPSFPVAFTASSSPRPIVSPSAGQDVSLIAQGPDFTGNPSPVSGLPSGYRLYDTFDSLRSDLWTVSSYKPDSDTLTTTFLPSNVRSLDGRLVLRASVANNKGGEYRSNGKFSPGKYRASIKVDQAPGTYLTFFAYVWPSEQGDNVQNEIDVELIINHGKTTAMLSTWRDYTKTQYLYELPFDPSADYHTYGFDWYTDRVEFYIDDMTMPVWTSHSNIPQDPMYVYFNSWVDKDHLSDYGNGVSTEYVDWVSVE